MKAAVLVEKGRVEVRDVPEPTVGPEDVLIAPRAVGICGSDLHLYKHGRIGTSIVQGTMVLGHELAGEIVGIPLNTHEGGSPRASGGRPGRRNGPPGRGTALGRGGAGSGASHLKPGDRVIVEPGISCGACFWCHRGEYNLCPDVRFLGIPPSDGAMCERLAVPARFVHRLPEAMSWSDGAMIEPFAVGLQATKSAGVGPGESVVVMGAGPIGLMILQAARIHGATTLIAVDVDPRPLELAGRLGATATLDARQTDLADRVRDLTDGRGADHAIEAVGVAQSVQTALDLVRRGGTLTLVGIAPEPGVPLDTIKIVRTGITVRSSFRYAHVHPAAIALAAEGRADLRALVTHRYPLGDVSRAFDDVANRRDGVVKAVVEL